jgi:hypothetical protein
VVSKSDCFVLPSGIAITVARFFPIPRFNVNLHLSPAYDPKKVTAPETGFTTTPSSETQKRPLHVFVAVQAVFSCTDE